jgi:hypothetical protein
MDVVLGSEENFKLLFPQKLNPVYAGNRISRSRDSLDSCVLYSHLNLYFPSIAFHSDFVTNILINFSENLIRGLHATPTLLLWQVHRSPELQ